jgi:4-hydroxy-3-polyprenylbenzoate decarboxylase
MAFRNITEFISLLEKNGELIRIKEFVNPNLEITEITDRFSKQPGGGKALLFENTGTNFPVLTNALGSYRRICMALGVEKLDNFNIEIQNLLQILTTRKNTFLGKIKILPQLAKVSGWTPKSISGKGACQEVIINNPDLKDLPILKCWPYDGERFVTLPMVHTLDTVTGIRNMGMYRMQLIDNNTTGMHWHMHKTGAKHFEEYKRSGKKMPVSVSLGGDPVYSYCATAPLPEGIDEYILAGFIRKKPVKLVKCITNDLEVPSDVDFVIEGYVDPSEELFWEGPFGDHTGFYSLEDWYPRFHITCITHRKNAIYPATIVGVPPMEDAWIAEATGKLFFTPMKFSFAPELISMDLPVAGVAHNLALLTIDNRYPGQAFKVINSLWGAGQMMFNKVMIVCDKNDISLSYSELFSKIVKQIKLPEQILFSRGPLDVLDHASDLFAFGGKLGIDATCMGEPCDFKYSNSGINAEMHIGGVAHLDLSWAERDVPIILMTINEGFNPNNDAFLKDFINQKNFQGIKIFIYFNEGVNLSDHFLLAWLFLGNIDPMRDFRILKNKTSETVLFIDATQKTKNIHNFSRPWPNVVASDDDTISKIDNNWNKYVNSEFITSPSMKYKGLIKYGDATAHINK